MNTRDYFGKAGVGGKPYNRFERDMPWHSRAQELLSQQAAIALQRIQRPQILEIGSGNGATTERLVKNIPEAKIISIDPSAEMLREAKGRVNSKNVTWMRADIMDKLCVVPRPWEGQFDAIVSGFTIHNLQPDDRDMLFTNLTFSMKKGGWFMNADLYANDDDTQHTEDLARHIISMDVFDDDPVYRLKWLIHYLEDEKIKMTCKEQLDAMKARWFKKQSFTRITPMAALFVAQFVGIK